MCLNKWEVTLGEKADLFVDEAVHDGVFGLQQNMGTNVSLVRIHDNTYYDVINLLLLYSTITHFR